MTVAIKRLKGFRESERSRFIALVNEKETRSWLLLLLFYYFGSSSVLNRVVTGSSGLGFFFTGFLLGLYFYFFAGYRRGICSADCRTTEVVRVAWATFGYRTAEKKKKEKKKKKKRKKSKKKSKNKELSKFGLARSNHASNSCTMS